MTSRSFLAIVRPAVLPHQGRKAQPPGLDPMCRRRGRNTRRVPGDHLSRICLEKCKERPTSCSSCCAAAGREARGGSSMVTAHRMGGLHLDEVRLLGGPLDGTSAWVDDDGGVEQWFASIGGGLSVAVGSSESIQDRLIVHRYRRRDHLAFEHVPERSAASPAAGNVFPAVCHSGPRGTVRSWATIRRRVSSSPPVRS